MELEARGAGTVLRLTKSSCIPHRGYMECAVGWGEALALLNVYLEIGYVGKQAG
jgi:hypothetical protein